MYIQKINLVYKNRNPGFVLQQKNILKITFFIKQVHLKPFHVDSIITKYIYLGKFYKLYQSYRVMLQTHKKTGSKKEKLFKYNYNHLNEYI